VLEVERANRYNPCSILARPPDHVEEETGMKNSLSQKPMALGIRIIPSGSLITLIVLLLLQIKGTAQGSSGQLEQNPASKQEDLQLREYLPVLLQKALLANERDFLGQTEELLKLAKALQEGGDVSQLETHQTEREGLQCRIRVLQLEADYLDAVDKFKLRFALPADHLGKMEERILLPMGKQLRKYTDTLTLLGNAQNEAAKHGAAEATGQLRAQLRKILTTSELVKDLRFRERIERDWKEWEKFSPVQLQKQHETLLDERRHVLGKQVDLVQQGMALNPIDQQRLDELSFKIELGDFESTLRTNESQPWKNVSDLHKRGQQHQAEYGYVMGAFEVLLIEARNERLHQLHDTWPKLPSLSVKNVDLMTVDLHRAESILESFQQAPEALRASKKALRAVRLDAETYPIRLRLLELAVLDVETLPPSVRARPGPALLQHLRDEQRSFSELKSQILTVWIHCLLERLKLYHELGLTQP
jgi:hypothetical protein